DRIPRGDIRHRDIAGVEPAILGDDAVPGERRAAELREIDVQLDVGGDVKASCDGARRFDFARVNLAVADRQSVQLVALLTRPRPARGRREATAQENDRFSGGAYLRR